MASTSTATALKLDPAGATLPQPTVELGVVSPWPFLMGKHPEPGFNAQSALPFAQRCRAKDR